MHVYRWDLDRTYLDTDIHSMRGLLRAAVETAAEKQNIPGSAALLRALVRHDPDARVVVLSGSPTQLRDVLMEKLALDGVRVDRLVLKDSLSSLKRGRLRAVTGQVGYKLPQLLKLREGLGPGVHETLFGDDSEVDALVYSVYADAIAGRLKGRELSRIMEAGGAYSDAVRDALASLDRVGHSDAVRDIFIRCDHRVRVAQFALLGPRVIPVFSWFQAALVLWHRKRLDATDVFNVARAIAEQARVPDVALAGLLQDIVRRHHLPPEAARAWLDDAIGLGPLASQLHRALDLLGDPPQAPNWPSTPQYLAFLKAVEGQEPA